MSVPVEKPAARFDRNTQVYGLGLLLLGLGLTLQVGVAMALIVLGAILTGVGIATSFFITWLAVTVKEKK
jgi:hypothetical protein